MSKSTNERIFDIMSLIIDEINTDQLDTPDRRVNEVSGEINPYYNRDAVYFLGGIINQIAWSISSKSKYINDIEHKMATETENNPTNADTEALGRAMTTASASYQNALFIYDLFVNTFNALTGWTWNDGKQTEDFGQKWFAEYKDNLNGNKYSTKYSAKDREDTIKKAVAQQLKKLSIVDSKSSK
jgi:hypothetical protein